MANQPIPKGTKVRVTLPKEVFEAIVIGSNWVRSGFEDGGIIFTYYVKRVETGRMYPEAIDEGCIQPIQLIP